MQNSNVLQQNISNEKIVVTRMNKKFQNKAGFLFNSLFMMALLIVVYGGWKNRDKLYINAEEGLGYYLGIIGGVMMLTLLLYPLRKNLKIMRNLLPVRFWFRMHMLFGILGPTLIVFHSGFQLGSTNSSVALFSMLIVAFSGLFGRYFYSKIHHGLYGRRKSLDELLIQTDEEYKTLESALNFDQQLVGRLSELQNLVYGQSKSHKNSGLVSSLLHSRRATILSCQLVRKTRKSIKTLPDRSRQPVTLEALKSYSRAVQLQAEFRVFENLFSLWHILHLPLFFLLIITGFFHVYAVHVY